MQKNYFQQYIHKSSIKQRNRTLQLDHSQLHSRKHSRSLMNHDDRFNTLTNGFQDRRYSVYKTPTNAKKKIRAIHTANSNSSKPSNHRKQVGSPDCKIKLKNLVESGVLKSEISHLNTKVKVPLGFKILKQIKSLRNQRIYLAQKITSQKLILFLQLDTSKHLLKLYKHFFHEDKPKRVYFKNPYMKTFLQPIMSHNSSTLYYSFEGEWPLETQLQAFDFKDDKLQITDKSLSTYFRDDPKFIKKIILQVCKMLTLLQQHKISHGHLRKDSLLVILGNRSVIKAVKVYGFDNWFYFSQFQQKLQGLIGIYTPPEILNFFMFQKQMQFDRGMLSFMELYGQNKSWLFDMWALGVVVLELVLGFPLYLQNEKAVLNGVPFEPVFTNSTPVAQIISKQLDVIFSLDSVLKQKQSVVAEDPQIRHLVKAMLNINPSKRLSPKQVILYLS